MSKLSVFNQITLDGYFAGANGDISWAHGGHDDTEWNQFISENASGGGVLLFGRVTYEMMAGYWPTPAAAANDPVVAKGMNSMPKVVFSRTMDEAKWENTRLMKSDLPGEVRKLKNEGKPLTILGSGSIVSQLAQENLIDEYQMVIAPLALGSGRSMFEGITNQLNLRLAKTRSFNNGKIVLWYESTAKS